MFNDKRFICVLFTLFSCILISVCFVEGLKVHAADRKEYVTKINTAKEKALKADILGVEGTVGWSDGHQIRRNILEDNISRIAHMVEYIKESFAQNDATLDYWFDVKKDIRYYYDNGRKQYMFEPQTYYDDYKDYLNLEYYLDNENVDGADISGDAVYKAIGDEIVVKYYKDIYVSGDDTVISSDGKAVECFVVSHLTEYEAPKLTVINGNDDAVINTDKDLNNRVYNTAADDKLKEIFDAYKNIVHYYNKDDYLIGKDDGKIYMIINCQSKDGVTSEETTVDFYYPTDNVVIPTDYTKAPSLIKNILIDYNGMYYCSSYEGKNTVLKLSSCKTKKAKKRNKLVVPNTVKYNNRSYKVIGVDSRAFFYNEHVQNITLGANVTEIGKEAFFGCSKIKKVTVKSKHLKKISKEAFYTDGNKFTLKVPKGKKKAYKKL
nr:leucine-rich repeat domain-containing protein [Lachnospiraceae bacterium]